MAYIEKSLRTVTDGIGTGFGSTEAERHQARMAVCHLATGRDDAAELMSMLGLTTQQQPRTNGACRNCGRVLSLAELSPKGGGGKLCGTCRRKQPKAGEK